MRIRISAASNFATTSPTNASVAASVAASIDCRWNRLLIRSARGALLGIVLCGVGTSSGCNFVPKTSSLRWPWSKEKKKELPERILPVWTDSVLYQPNQPGIRGFGGRVYFYVKDGKDPVEVDGALAVYVFDAEDEQHDQKPLRKFAFTPEQFASHMSHTSIGPSYSVWLPWGEVGGPPRKLSLIARFEGREGGTVISDPTIKLLPGVIAKKTASDSALAGSKTHSPFQLTGHSTEAGTQSATTDNRETTGTASKRDIGTIELPPSFQRHLFNDAKAKEAGSAPVPTDPLDAAKLESQAAAALGTTTKNGRAGNEPEATSSSITTEVSDYRSRKQQSLHTVTGEDSKSNIRTGRWIEAPSRIKRN